jgi:N6-L-threonylcarbamoyladenine synthase
LLVLGIETSCDETAAAIVADGEQILANVVASQEDLHGRFGGVVPEIASRAHLARFLPVLTSALSQARLDLQAMDAIAVSNRPGLVGALLVGLSAAKTLAWALGCPMVGINHLEGHIIAALMGEKPEFPLVALVASGGHTSLFLSTSLTQHRLIGQTTDDAAGEAFDKIASILGLGYLGGPLVEKAARGGNAGAFDFPRSLLGDDSLNFSFSGVKTAVLYHITGQDAARPPKNLSPGEVADVAASFQEAVVDVLVEKLLRAARREKIRAVVLGGGVAANKTLRDRVSEAAHAEGLNFYVPPLNLCTDNAVMVAALGYHKLKAGLADDLTLDAYPRASDPGA